MGEDANHVLRHRLAVGLDLLFLSRGILDDHFKCDDPGTSVQAVWWLDWFVVSCGNATSRNDNRETETEGDRFLLFAIGWTQSV
jgi:hypothetical protein